MKIKKILLGVCLSLCLATSGLVLGGCGDGKGENTASMSINDVFAMGMVSASNYLESTQGETKTTLSINASREVDENTKSTIKQYTKMFEGLLSNGLHPSKEDNNDVDYSEYSNRLVMTLGDVRYTMYYNEVLEGSKTELDEDEIETETISMLSGRVIRSDDNATCYVVGSREIESETKKTVTEVEHELKLVFSENEMSVGDSTQFEYLEDNLPNRCVYIEQQSENGEIEFEYTTKNGIDVKTVEVDFEHDNGKKELEIEIEDGSSKVEYKIVRVDTNKYSVKVKENGYKTVLYLTKTDDNWVFTSVEE